ncbi:MAG: hypothetical protein U5Q03_05635 [Bacteroidota bacterium]|nr:hypothetical protein [Bacteroidota bacterium]
MKRKSKIKFSANIGNKNLAELIVLVFCTLMSANTLFSQLPPNINIPDSESGGNPIGEVLVAGGKLVTYSPKNILIYDAADNSLLETIEISNVGKFNPRYFIYTKHICDIQVMTYNETENDVYYISPDLNIFCLNLDNYSTELLLQTPTQINHFKYLIGPVNLKFDANHNRLFWVIQGRDENHNSIGRFHVHDSYLAAYDVAYTNGSPSLTLIEDQFEVNSTGNYDNSFHNLVFCDDNDYFFVPKKEGLIFMKY